MLTKEIDRVGLELNNDVCAESWFPMLPERPTIEPHLVELVHFLTIARVFAEIQSERNPEYMVALKRFQDELWLIQNEFLRTL